jgi:hypothetical protein
VALLNEEQFSVGCLQMSAQRASKMAAFRSLTISLRSHLDYVIEFIQNLNVGQSDACNPGTS